MISYSLGSGTVIFSLVWAVTSSSRRMTGVRYFSAKLKAVMVMSRHSWTLEAESTMMGWSPWVPHRACMTSPWEGEVGSPVLGPAAHDVDDDQGRLGHAGEADVLLHEGRSPARRWRSWPLRPAKDAPMTAPRLAISSSIWMNTPSGEGVSRSAICSMISLEGVMGYPA